MMKKILVIDDDMMDRQKIVTALEREGYSVVEASSAVEAMKKARETLPDLVIADVLMPDTTGFDLCRQVKAAFQPHPPLVLMVTGKAAAVNVALAHQMGADGFEAKTPGMPFVVKAVRDILSRNKG